MSHYKIQLRSKYGGYRTNYDGHWFASKLESAVYQLLKLRESSGEIKLIQVQDHVRVCCPPGAECNHKMKIEYIADFKCQYVDSGLFFWTEAKGFANEKWPLKRRLWMHYGAGDLEIWGGTYKYPKLMEKITPGYMKKGIA